MVELCNWRPWFAILPARDFSLIGQSPHTGPAPDGEAGHGLTTVAGQSPRLGPVCVRPVLVEIRARARMRGPLPFVVGQQVCPWTGLTYDASWRSTDFGPWLHIGVSIHFKGLCSVVCPRGKGTFLVGNFSRGMDFCSPVVV